MTPGDQTMDQKRRTFVIAASSLGAASLLCPTILMAEAVTGSVDVIFKDGYIARLKEWFFLHNLDASEQGDLKLIKVLDRGSDSQIEQFSLKLRSRRGATALPSGYYQVAGEPFALYIAHTHENKDKQFYRAEFALLL